MRLTKLEVFGIGVIAGACVGAVAALLLAPTSGAGARRVVKARLLGFAETAKHVAERAESAAGLLTERVDHYLGRDEELAWQRVREIREGVARYTETRLSN